MDKKRFYNFTFIIYEDDERFEKQFLAVQEENSAIWIKHDKDLDEEGELKKAHYHVVLKLRNACTISAIAKRLEVEENMVEPIKKSFNGALKYLIHFGSDNKYQYDAEEVKSNDDSLLRKFLDLVSKEVPESEKVMYIQEYIESFNDYVDLAVLGKYVLKHNMWDGFRRNMMYFCKIVDNHNAKISAKKYHIENEYYDLLNK